MAAHRVVPARVGSRNWEDRAIRDGGLEMNEMEQVNDARHASKHNQMHRVVMRWGSGRPEKGYQSAPESPLEEHGACHLSNMGHAIWPLRACLVGLVFLTFVLLNVSTDV